VVGGWAQFAAASNNMLAAARDSRRHGRVVSVGIRAIHCQCSRHSALAEVD